MGNNSLEQMFKKTKPSKKTQPTKIYHPVKRQMREGEAAKSGDWFLGVVLNA